MRQAIRVNRRVDARFALGDLTMPCFIHVGKRPRVLEGGASRNLWCDAEIIRRHVANPGMGTTTPPPVKEAKQAEFLVEQSFAWELVNRVV